jgi:hypothetical protein
MLRLAVTQPVQREIAYSPALLQMLALSQVFAVLWWVIVLWLRTQGIEAWADQIGNFRAGVDHIANPYEIPRFVHPPWLLVIFVPFRLVPLELSTLLQSGLYFAMITAIIHKFGGGRRVLILVLSSYFGFDAILQLNVDWIVCIGLLVPVAFSGPFLLIKPQLALGYYLAFRWREWLKTGVITAGVIAISLLIWPGWPLEIVGRVGGTSVEQFFNIAPLHLLPGPLSLIIGVPLAWWAFRRRDPALGIIAWLFFTPYITLYSLLMTFAMVAIRLPLLALVISPAMWFIYGGVILSGLISR